MFDESRDQDFFGMSDALQALSELERNTDAAILAQRSSERIDIQARIFVRPANASQRHQFTIEGVTADVSNGGCMALFSRPIMVGDMFWITFDDERLRLGSLFARCLRCRMVREDAYETGFRFLNDVDLASALTSSEGAFV